MGFLKLLKAAFGGSRFNLSSELGCFSSSGKFKFQGHFELFSLYFWPVNLQF